MCGKAICLSSQDDGYYLFSCDESWEVMYDTWHGSVEEVKSQAEFEHPGIGDRWVHSK